MKFGQLIECKKLVIHNQSIRRYFSVVFCCLSGFLVGVSKLLHTGGELTF